METLAEAIMEALSWLFDKIEERCGFITAWALMCALALGLVVSIVWAVGRLA
jgi:hypothetical protein